MTSVEVIEIGTLGGASEIIEVANVSGPTGAQGPQGTPGTSAVTLDPVNVQIATYTAAPGQFVPMDSTNGNVFVMFPATASADRSVIAVRHVTQGGTNTVTCQAQGVDKFNKPGSPSTTYPIPLVNQSVVFTYDSTVNVWYPVTQSIGMGTLDLRYAAINRGIPAGGTAAQALVKNSVTDYDASWATVSGGSGGAPSGAAGGSLAGSYPNPTLAPAAVADLNAFTSALKGLAPASGGGTTAFLRADGTWAVPAGGGGGGTAASTTFNSFGTIAATDVQSAIQELLVETTPIQMPTAVKTINYGASGSEFVPGDTTGQSISISLPQNQAKGTQVRVRHLIQGGTNTVSVLAQGLDILHRPSSGITSMVLPLVGQEVTFLYDNGPRVWYVIVHTPTASEISSTAVGQITATNVQTAIQQLDAKVPASGGGTVNYLRADGTWVDPLNPPPSSQSFTATGAQQTFVVPTGVTALTIALRGASGQNSLNQPSTGGSGAITTGQITVTPGETLYVFVGKTGDGWNTAGFNGAGQGRGTFSGGTLGGAGGGATDIRRGGNALANRVAVAGGGGGAGNRTASKGGDAGPNGSPGLNASAGTTGGGGGTQTAGGAVGGGNGGNGQAGSLGQGGNADFEFSSYYPGAGGGGYYGGGGGGQNGQEGGGGGSSLTPAGGTTVTGNTGDGTAVLSWNVLHVNGIPTGGTTNQALMKTSSADYAATFQTMTATIVASTPVGEIPSTNVQAALANLDSRTAAAAWIDKLSVAADLYDDFVSQDVIASPGVIGALRWSIPTGVATLPTWQTASGTNGVGVFQLPVTLLDSFASINLTPDILELGPVFTAEWRLGLSATNDGSNNFDICVGLHNDIPRTVTDLVTTNASPTVTSATASFNILKDIGKTLSTPNVPVGTTIIAVPNATTATLSANATTGSSAQTAAIVGGTNGYWFKYSGASANWRACVGDSNTGLITNVDTGVVPAASNVFQKLRIRCDGGGNAFFYINGTLVSNMPINTNLPATSRYTPTASVRKSLGSTVKRVNIDYFGMHYEKVR